MRKTTHDQLAIGDVHVWTVTLDPARADAPAAAMLDTQERARAARFVFERDRVLFTRGHAALREILARYLSVAPACVMISAGRDGKPALGAQDHPADLRFNMSGSGDVALIAVSRGREVGVDLELVRPMHDLDSLTDIVLSAGERATFAALDESDRLAFFLDIWTRKEAYLKALGEGLARPLTRIECGAPIGGVRDADDTTAAERWAVTGWRTTYYHVALAVQTPVGQIAFKSLSR